MPGCILSRENGKWRRRMINWVCLKSGRNASLTTGERQGERVVEDELRGVPREPGREGSRRPRLRVWIFF